MLLQALADAGLPDLTSGTLNPLLNRPERDGLVASTWRAGEFGLARTYFTVTDRGDVSLDDGVGGRRDFAATIDAVLAPH